MTGDAGDGGADIAAVAARHGFGPGAVSALWDAMRRGGGRMAQFYHPELGGMGQWSGGMLQIGAMFDHALKARVAAACADLAEAALRASGHRGDAGPDPSGGPPGQGGAGPIQGWPVGLGPPSASGSQNGMRYAYFAEARRLAVEIGGRVTVYDTGRHCIFGVSQSQSRGQRLAFTGDDGTVDLDALRVVQA